MSCKWDDIGMTSCVSGWCYGYDTVLMHRHIQGDTLNMCERFGGDGNLYVQVIRTLWQSVEMEHITTPARYNRGQHF